MHYGNKYHWQLPDWPAFIFDVAQVQGECEAFLRGAARLAGRFEQVAGLPRQDAGLDNMVLEALHSFAIEGEWLSEDDLRSSLRNQLGLNPTAERIADPRAEGASALLLAVRQEVMSPLCEETLHHWHQLVMAGAERRFHPQPLQVGVYRQNPEPMQIVSGPVGYERVHYEAPPAERIPREMAQWLDWFNATAPDGKGTVLPGPVRAAVAHLWFESIHPYDDGNGRLGRAVAEKALFQSLGEPGLFSLSAIVDQQRKQYYEQLAQASRSLEITPWVQWFCQACHVAVEQATARVQSTLDKARFWQRHQQTPLNARQVKALNRLFEAEPEGFEGGLSAQKYAGLTRCSKATATRDLADLCDKRCLQAHGAGKATRYGLGRQQIP